LKIDAPKTTDISAILRPPGTFNRKIANTPRPVICGPLKGPYSRQDLACFVEPAVSAAGSNVVDHPTRRRQIADAVSGGLPNPTPDMKRGYKEGGADEFGQPSGRDIQCTRRAGWFLGPGKRTYDQALAELLEWNKLNNPPLSDEDVRKCLDSIAAKEAEKQKLTSDRIAEMNKKHFMISNLGGKALIGEWVPSQVDPNVEVLSLQGKDAFVLRYANQRLGGQTLGAHWLQHNDRRTHSGLALVPGDPREPPKEVLPGGRYNLWRGFGVTPKQGDCRLLLEHIQNIIADGDMGLYEYIMFTLAWWVQHPGERAEIALVLQGLKGSGKGVLARVMRRIFGTHGLQIFNSRHLTGNFNAHQRGCLCLIVDEAFWAGDKVGEAVLKGLITEPTIMIEQKGVDAVLWSNMLKVMILGNADHMVPASWNERRYVVVHVSGKYAAGKPNHREYHAALNDEIDNGGIEAFLHGLLQMPSGKFHPRQGYDTAALQRQKLLSMTPLEKWWSEVLRDGQLPGERQASRAGAPKNFLRSRALREDAKARVSQSEWYRINDTTIGDFIRERGAISRRTENARGWILPPLAQARAEWLERFPGVGPWDDPSQTDWAD
jgi:hypothetical protein